MALGRVFAAGWGAPKKPPERERGTQKAERTAGLSPEGEGWGGQVQFDQRVEPTWAMQGGNAGEELGHGALGLDLDSVGGVHVGGWGRDMVRAVLERGGQEVIFCAGSNFLK